MTAMLLNIAGTLFGLLTAASIAYYLLSILAANRFLSKRRPVTVETPPATIMVPLYGADFRAFENYVSLLNQDYPSFQVLFGVGDPADSSVEVVRKLMADYPDHDIGLATGPWVRIGENPKVNNLRNMLGQAKHGLLVLVDSDIRVGPDYLRCVASELCASGAGLVTCLYRAGEAPGFAAKLEAAGIAAEFAPGVLVAEWMQGISFAFGATIAITREKLEAIGGFEAVADYLADDYMLGNVAHRAGFPVLLSSYTVETVLPAITIGSFLKHQVRWARGIRACRPLGHTGMIVTNGLVLGLFTVLACWFSTPSLLLFCAAAAARMASAWFCGVIALGDGILGKNLWAVPLRDLFSFYIWCMAIAGKTVDWRGKNFKIVEDGKIRPIS